MFTKISVLVPTRNRLDRLLKMLKSYDETVGFLPYAELVFRVDDDDYDTQDVLALHHHRVVVGPRGGGYQNMTGFFNELRLAASGDVLMCGNDDMVFRTREWVSIILTEASKFPDGVFDFGVSTFNEGHFPFSIVSRKMTDALGFLWDPRIYWGDIFLRDVAAFFGRAIMLPHVQIDHEWVGFHPDKTFQEADQQSIMRRDPTYWSGTHRTCVNEAIAKLQEVLWEQPV